MTFAVLKMYIEPYYGPMKFVSEVWFTNAVDIINGVEIAVEVLRISRR